MELLESIEQQTEFARQKLSETKKQILEENSPFQGLLFIGNRHETVPFRLLTDKYLTPRAKTAWQMIKLNAQQFQGTVFPSYEELGYWLSDRAFQNKSLSRKTISQTLLLLRLTRWLTLCETVRNDRGQILGNVYIMNDEPLSLSDSLQINGDYLRLLEKSQKHADPLIKEVATAIIQDIEEQRGLSHFVSHLGVIAQRYQQLKDGFHIQHNPTDITPNIAEAVNKVQQGLLNSNMELSLETEISPSSNMELSNEDSPNPLIYKAVPNGNSVSQYSTSTNNIKYSTSTVTLSDLQLTDLEKNTIAQEIASLDDELKQAVLFEAHQRISQGNVKKPAGYLMSLIHKAKTGQFKPYLINKSVETQMKQGSTRTSSHPAGRVLSSPSRILGNTQRSSELIKQFTQSLHN